MSGETSPLPLRGNDDYCAACGAEITFWKVLTSRGERYVPYDAEVGPDETQRLGMAQEPHNHHCPKRRGFRRLPEGHCRYCGSADVQRIAPSADALAGRVRCNVCHVTTTLRWRQLRAAA